MFRSSFFRNDRQGTLELDRLEAVLFDLDGTLIDVDMQKFVAGYLQRLTDRLGDLAHPRRVAAALRGVVGEMLNTTDGTQTMEGLLHARLEAEFGISADQYRERLEIFCRDDLPEFQSLVKPHTVSRKLVEACLDRGWRPVLATNPIFPRPIVEARLMWGGLKDLPFALITSYETARCCKPHVGFFREVLHELELDPSACLMVGNDTQHDLAAGQFGLQTCLLTPWQIDRPGRRYVPDWRGDHAALLALMSPPDPGSREAPSD